MCADKNATQHDILLLPSELWLMVIQYLDTNTFKSLMTYLYEENTLFTQSLYKMICIDYTTKHKQIMLMSSLIRNIKSYRTMSKYINFKVDFTNKMKNTNKSYNELFIEKHTYKSYIIKHKERYFQNDNDDKDISMFLNLTRYRGCNDDMPLLDNFTYYNIKLPVHDVVEITCRDIVSSIIL
jgi:hypothetical protein